MSKRSRQSAGLLMFRETGSSHEVFLVHPGGPYWAKKEEGAWTFPKGRCEDGEEPLTAAQREFQEETGFVSRGPYIDLGSVRQKSGKEVFCWAFEGDCDAGDLVSNSCEVEWPPRSHKRIVIPEIDRGAWFLRSEADTFIRQEQRPLLLRLEQHLKGQNK